MAIIGLQKGSGKRSRVREKSGNFDMDNEWQPCFLVCVEALLPSQQFFSLVGRFSWVEPVLSNEVK